MEAEQCFDEGNPNFLALVFRIGRKKVGTIALKDTGSTKSLKNSKEFIYGMKLSMLQAVQKISVGNELENPESISEKLC